MTNFPETFTTQYKIMFFVSSFETASSFCIENLMTVTNNPITLKIWSARDDVMSIYVLYVCAHACTQTYTNLLICKMSQTKIFMNNKLTKKKV